MKKITTVERDTMKARLAANVAEIKAWFEALNRVDDPNSPAAAAIMAHIDALVDEQSRIMGLSEEEIARINAEAEAAVKQQIQAEIADFVDAVSKHKEPR